MVVNSTVKFGKSIYNQEPLQFRRDRGLIMVTLKASTQGLEQIKQARRAKGWAASDFRWLETASETLGTSWIKVGVLAVGISEGTWKRFLAGKYPISAEPFKAYCQALSLDWEAIVEADHSSNKIEHPPNTLLLPSQCRADWSEAPDVSIFYGREAELNTVRQWAVRENCRLITLLGMGGIGKTTLSLRLAREIVNLQNLDRVPFEFVIWRSLRNAPPVEELLADLIQVLSEQQETTLPTQLEAECVNKNETQKEKN